MSTTTQMTPNSEGGYKALLLRARQLRASGGKSAYERATILSKVFLDIDFRRESGNLDDFRAAELLDDYVDDLALGFLDLRAMLEHFPEQRDWVEGRIRRMYAAMIEAKTQAALAKKIPRPATKTPEVKKVRIEQWAEEQRHEVIRAKENTEQVKSELQIEREEVNRLRAKVRDLQNENDRLRAQIAAMEMQLASARSVLESAVA